MKLRLAALFLAVLSTAVFAGANDTAGNYKPNVGSGTNAGVVILKSNDGVNSAPVNDTHPFPVAIISGGGGSPTVVTYTNKSGSITTGGTSQTLMASNGTRKRIIIENPVSTTAQGIGTVENLYINFTSAASKTSSSIELVPGGAYDSGSGPVSGEAITVLADTTGHKWVAKEAN